MAPRGSLGHVSNGEQITAVDRDGRYRLPWVPGRHRFLFIIPADGFLGDGAWWRDAEQVDPTKPADFRLRPAQRRGRPDFAALHVTDFHVSEVETTHEVTPKGHPERSGIMEFPRARKIQGVLDGLLRRAPELELVIATGDLTDAGDVESLRAVARVFRRFPIPVFPIFGGHDGNVERAVNGGTDHYNVVNWTRFLAPPYYSWHWGGRHFLSFFSETSNFLDPLAREMHEAFVAEDLRLFGRKYPVTICSHKHPYPWNETIFHQYRVDSWLHGHFHCNRVMQERKIRVFSTSTPGFGSMDSNVVPARLIRFTPRGAPTGPILVPPRSGSRPVRHRTESTLRRQWQLTSQQFSRLATPCVTSDRIYCGIVDDSAGVDGGVARIDACTGDVRWKIGLKGSVEAPLVSAGDRVIAVTQTGLVSCLRSTDGRVIWQHQLPEAFDRWIYSKPLLFDETVVVGTTSCLACLDVRDGSVRWTFKSPRKSSDAFGQFQGPLVVNGRIFLAGYRTGSFLLDATNGNVLRANDDAVYRYASRVVPNDHRYVIGDGCGWLSCFNLTTGERLWCQRVSDNGITSGFVPFLGHLLGGTADGLVRCSIHDGHVLASRSFGRDVERFVAYRDRIRSVPGTPCVDGDLAWVASGDAHLNLVRGPRLRLVSRLALDEPIISGLAMTESGSILGVALDGNLSCFAQSTTRESRRCKRLLPA